MLSTAGACILTVLLVGAPTVTIGATQKARSPSAVIDKPGRYVSPDGKCDARLEVASMGGFLILTAGRLAAPRLRVEDVVEMAWVSGHVLVYTASPIYGVPGIYVYNCDSNTTKRIVAPRNRNKAYPEGADFFELERISTAKPITVYFYYAPDVDNVDETKLRTPAFLFQVHLDGTDFRKTEPHHP